MNVRLSGSHDIESERDIRDAGGALGPVNGRDPELNNLTCSMTVVDPGDIVYLTTDGISDNYDPVVTKIAVPKRRHSDPEINATASVASTRNGVPDTSGKAVVITDTSRRMISTDGRPEMSPHERHQYAVKEMERVVHEFELFTEETCCAQELCGALLQHVLKLTDPKRKVLENPDLYGKKLRSKDRKRRDSEIVSKMSRAPGKLDHATIVAYEVGTYRGDEDEDYEVDSEDDLDPAPGRATVVSMRRGDERARGQAHMRTSDLRVGDIRNSEVMAGNVPSAQHMRKSVVSNGGDPHMRNGDFQGKVDPDMRTEGVAMPDGPLESPSARQLRRSFSWTRVSAPMRVDMRDEDSRVSRDVAQAHTRFSAIPPLALQNQNSNHRQPVGVLQSPATPGAEGKIPSARVSAYLQPQSPLVGVSPAQSPYRASWAGAQFLYSGGSPQHGAGYSSRPLSVLAFESAV